LKDATRYQMVPATIKDISARPPRGIYSGLLKDFMDGTKAGDFLEVKADGEELTAEESRKVYQGLLQAIRYRKQKGIEIPVEVHRSAGRVYLHRV
jgi:hypothetical protein